MSSVAQIPDRVVVDGHPSESAPLLGRAGDVVQHEGDSLFSNLYKGTAWLAQAGALLLVALVWPAVVAHPPWLPLFSPHPLLQSLGVVAVVEAVLVLQPTQRPGDKTRGAWAHALLQLLSFVLLAAGVALIEANKVHNHGVHFHSLHGYLGVLTAAVLVGQYVFGLAIWAVPLYYGNSNESAAVERAKALWKHHRRAGYLVVLPLLLATVATATATDFNANVLHIKLWAVLVAAALIVAGVYPRIHPRKLGYGV